MGLGEQPYSGLQEVIRYDGQWRIGRNVVCTTESGAFQVGLFRA